MLGVDSSWVTAAVKFKSSASMAFQINQLLAKIHLPNFRFLTLKILWVSDWKKLDAFALGSDRGVEVGWGLLEEREFICGKTTTILNN